MVGNVKHAANQRKKRARRERQERLREEMDAGEWMHLTVSIDGEPSELWVKSDESDEAVRLYAQKILNEDYVRELRSGTRFKELKRRLKRAEWITAFREEMPDRKT